MSETNCTCDETEYLCSACVQEHCKQEAEFYDEWFYHRIMAIADSEELPF